MSDTQPVAGGDAYTTSDALQAIHDVDVARADFNKAILNALKVTQAMLETTQKQIKKLEGRVADLESKAAAT
jgi:hypothetical protein